VGEVFMVEEGETTIGRSSTAQVHVEDQNASRLHCALTRQGDRITVRDLGSTNGTFINGDRLRAGVELREGDKLQVGSGSIFKFSWQDSIEAEAHRQLYESALLDSLTHCYNKKYFHTRLQSEVAYALRHGTLLSLVLFDLDHFKQINDTHGHPAGDFVLSRVAELVAATVRREDVFSRYGGEEFAVIGRGINLDGAIAFGERIRNRIRGYEFTWGANPLKVTVSIGVSELSATQARDGEQLLEVTDKALYRAKAGGRDRVVIGR
jgi:diguanylate cyclase (GGDEF)-like protein